MREGGKEGAVGAREERNLESRSKEGGSQFDLFGDNIIIIFLQKLSVRTYLVDL